ncbi:MAG: NAD(P)/FAD-dependent oxidoreductase [Candidatus Binatia bacterium]
MERRPAIIVGAGPGGSATALSLHRLDAGLARDVLILEKSRHPRSKVCAGGLIPAGRRWMAEHDVPLAIPHVTVHRAQVTTPNRVVSHEDRDLCYVIRRAELDALLVDAVRARGTEVREQEPVLALERADGGVRVTTATGAYHAPLVLGADGAGSVVRRRLVDPARRHLARAVMTDVPASATRWEGFARARYDFDFRLLRRGLKGYLWAFPCLIDGVPHANIGAYALTPDGARLDAEFAAFLGELGAAGARRVAFPIHWYAPGAQVAADRAWLIGDAAGVDALMGEGISLAMEYGELAAGALVAARRVSDFSGATYQSHFDASWLAAKLRRLHLSTKLFYGPTHRIWFALAERSRRVRALGLRWYNGVDGWDRRSGWEALRSLITYQA